MIFVYIAACLIVILSVIVYIKYFGRYWKMSSTMMADVRRVEERVVRDQLERREETALVCGYHVAGKEYQIERVIPGRHEKQFPVGSKVPVRYNPSDPDMAELAIR